LTPGLCQIIMIKFLRDASREIPPPHGDKAMVSDSMQTKRIRKRKKSRQGKARKRLLRRCGSTPSLAALLDGGRPCGTP